MSERLRPRDLAVLAGESPTAPRHNATVEIFDPADSGFDYARLVELVGDRISFVPRYRQRVATVPGRLANPVWVDDPDFDLGYHVRRSALPRPGSADQLRELVARIISRPLDRHRPLWEVYFVEGLEDGRVAVLSKSHEVLVDGVHTVDLAQVLLDRTPEPRPCSHDDWRPLSAPTQTGLVAGGGPGRGHQPRVACSTRRGRPWTPYAARPTPPPTGPGRSSERSPSGGPSGDHPLGGTLSQQRRLVTVRTSLADYLEVRRAHGGTVNDAILATVTGALRGWLLARSESMSGVRNVRTVVPVSVVDREPRDHLAGQPDHGLPRRPARRRGRARSSGCTRCPTRSRPTRRPGVASPPTGWPASPGFAPSTFHAIGARVAADEARRGFQLSVTNVPGPQSPLYAAGARMLETYPVHPLLPGHALAIGVTSYDGHVFYGITADRDRVPDADVLGQCVPEALDRAARHHRRPGQGAARSAHQEDEQADDSRAS